MIDGSTRMERAIGAAIRAARCSRGLTQSDLAAHLGVTRATVASYETSRRKIPAETLIHIARLCGKPLGCFAPVGQSPIAELAEAYPARSDALPAKAPARQALTNALQLRPDAIPLLMEFLEAWLSDQAAHADREPLEGRDEGQTERHVPHHIPRIILQPRREGGAIIPLRNAPFSSVDRVTAYTVSMRGTHPCLRV